MEEKSGGVDGLTIAHIKAGGMIIAQALTHLYNTCLKNANFPEEWKTAKLIIMPKKGDKRSLNNHRPLSLLSVLYKIFSKILLTRIEDKLDIELEKHQAGIRKNYSTVDHIFVIKELIKKANDYNLSVSLLFLDYEKARDSLKTDSIINMLKKRNISSRICKILEDMYSRSNAEYKSGNITVKINIRKGVRQGSFLLKYLYQFYMI